MWNCLPNFPNVALVATRLLSMHTTAYASERNWSMWDLMFAKNHAKLSREIALKIIYPNHVFADFFEAELLDLSLEDDV